MDVLDEIQSYAASGLTENEVKTLLSIEEFTDSELASYRLGKCRGKSEVAQALLDKCKMGNMQAISLYLKCNGWAETQKYDIASMVYGDDNEDVSVDDILTTLKEHEEEIPGIDKFVGSGDESEDTSSE